MLKCAWGLQPLTEALLPACRFTSDSKEQFAGVSGVCITTYTMIAYSGKRSEESEAVSTVQTPVGQLLLIE